LVAFRTPKTIAVGTPTFLPPDDNDPDKRNRISAPDAVLGPIQGIRHRDGTWTGTGPNYLYSGRTRNSEWHIDTLMNFPATAATVQILENGPLRAKTLVSYTGLRPGWENGDWNDSTPASDNGFYNITITLEAGQQAIMFELDTDCQPQWDV